MRGNHATAHLIADIEQLRQHLDIERWLVLGYSETNADRVTEIVLFGVTTGRHAAFDWTFRGRVAIFLPDQWDLLLAALPLAERNGDLLEAHRVGDSRPTLFGHVVTSLAVRAIPATDCSRRARASAGDGGRTGTTPSISSSQESANLR